jgi:hypothetical protein
VGVGCNMGHASGDVSVSLYVSHTSILALPLTVLLFCATEEFHHDN